ncbi:MAG: glycosyltransferase family 2 protein [Phocaeicola sp.]
MTNANLISIIIPVYNVEEYLIACLDSCFSQSYSSIEVLAINDGSKDSSGAILDEYKLKEKRLIVFHQDNAGVVAARQLGIDNCKGEFIMFVDSDDTLTENAIEKLYQSMNDEVDIVVGGMQEYFKKYNYIRKSPNKHNGIKTADYLIEQILLKEIQWGLCAKLYKKYLLDNLEQTNFKLGEDACVFIQTTLKSRNIAFIETIVYTYLQRDNSAVHSPKKETVQDIYNFRCWIENFLKKSGYKITSNLNYFVVDGYVECLLFKASNYLSSKERRKEINIRSKKLAKPLTSWQKTLLITDSFNCSTIIAELFGIVRKIKFNLKMCTLQ